MGYKLFLIKKSDTVGNELDSEAELKFYTFLSDFMSEGLVHKLSKSIEQSTGFSNIRVHRSHLSQFPGFRVSDIMNLDEIQGHTFF